MEWFLNSLWVLIAVSAVALWRTHRTRAGQRERNILCEATALGCVLVFLFFAVSMTDDLRQNLFLTDAARGKDHSLHAGGQHGAQHAAWDDAAPAVPSQGASFAPARFVAIVTPDLTCFPALPPSAPSAGRSPPQTA